MFGLFGMEIMEAEILGADMMMMGAMNMGMGMRGIGYCPPGCIGPCCRRVIVCQPGCMGPCCINRRRVICQPGCTLPCCQNTFINNNPISRYAPLGQNAYLPNQLLPQQQMVPQQQMAQQQMYQQQMENRQQMAYQQQISRQPMAQQTVGVKQATVVTGQGRSQNVKTPGMSDIERTKKEQSYIDSDLVQNQGQSNEAKVMVNNSYVVNSSQQGQSSKINPNYKEVILFQGEIYQRTGTRWQCVPASLTSQHFINIPLKVIDKLKIKAETQMNGTRIIKISSGADQYFYSVPVQQQLQWMLNLFYGKLVLLGYSPMKGQNSCVEGAILKKSFFGGWQNRYGTLTSQMLKISKQLGGLAEKSITTVSEIWSRFEIMKGSMIVIKMHCLGSKVQIAVPIENLLLWLRGLFNLLK